MGSVRTVRVKREDGSRREGVSAPIGAHSRFSRSRPQHSAKAPKAALKALARTYRLHAEDPR